MNTLELDQVKNVSVYIIDNEGNGYVGNVDPAYMALIAQMTQFYPVEGVESIPLNSIIKK